MAGDVVPFPSSVTNAHLLVEGIDATSRRSLVQLRFSDGSRMVARSSLLQGLGIGEGSAVFPATVSTIREHEHELSKAAAMRLAAKSERTEVEVRAALVEQGYSEPAIECSIAHLARMQGVSDERAAKAHVSSRSGRRAKGTRLLLQELRMRGIDDEVASVAVEDVDDDANAISLAATLMRQRTYQNFDSFAHRATGFLLRRGFRHGTAMHACREAWRAFEDEST